MALIRRNNTISVPCQDDPFGFNCEMVIGDQSYPIRRCTPYVNGTAGLQISVQCQDDTFGFNGEMVIGDQSYPIRRCTPYVNGTAVPEENQDNAAGEVLDSLTVNENFNVPAVVSTNTDVNQMGDGVSSGLMTPGSRRNRPEIMDTDGWCNKEKHMHPKGKKKAKRRGRK